MKFRKSSRKDHKQLKKQKKHAQSVKYLQWQKSGRSEPSGKIQKHRTNMGGINGQMNRIFSKLDIFRDPDEGQSSSSRNGGKNPEHVDSSDEDLGDRLERAYSGKEEKIEEELKESVEDRVARLKRENEEEDKEISRLEKMLYLNKRKNNNMPKSFVEEGLDFILEVVDKKYKKKYNDDMDLLDEADGELKNAFMRKNADGAEGSADENDGDDGEFARENEQRRKIRFADEEEGDDYSDEDMREESEDESGTDGEVDHEDVMSEDSGDESEKHEGDDGDDPMEPSDSEQDGQDEETSENEDMESGDDTAANVMAKLRELKEARKIHPQYVEDDFDGDASSATEDDEGEDDDDDDDGDEGSEVQIEEDPEDEADDFIRKKTNIGEDGSYEDIYGRKRSATGDVLSVTSQKYVPPARRLELSKTADIEKLQKQVKGLLNRLSETNLRPIAQQMAELYAKHSKNNVTSTLSVAICDAIFGLSATPERLVLEPALLCALLHANIGQEVGAQILEDVIDRLKSLLETGSQGKQMENVLRFLCYLFLFKVVSHGVIYDVLKKFDPVDECDVDYIMAILKTCGFALRRCDPLSLKELILSIQAKCKGSSSSRHRFMIDTLMALKNNNVSKISNCDPSASESALKSLRACLSKGAVLQELNVSLEDLYDARVRGKWWLVGSAWANEDTARSRGKDESETKLTEGVSSRILELAAKAGMNTDIRRSIFCIIMSAQDYIDASERILRLNLTHIQQRELCYVILLCITKEKQFNPFYAHLALFFCNRNKKVFSMTLQCAIWDFIKSIDSYAESKVKFLALFTALLVREKGLPLAVLKNIEFIDLSNDKVITFLRCFLLDVLKSLKEEEITVMFSKVALAGPKLELLKEGLLVFFRKFLLRNPKFLHDLKLGEIKSKLKIAEKALSIQNDKGDIDLFS